MLGVSQRVDDRWRGWIRTLLSFSLVSLLNKPLHQHSLNGAVQRKVIGAFRRCALAFSAIAARGF